MKDNKSISLFIDTATKTLSVGVIFGDKSMISEPMDSKKALEQTNAAIEKLASEIGFCLQDIDDFYCLLGLGSNTGIRLGLTIPKTIYAFNPNIHLYGIETMKLFLEDHREDLAALSDRAGNLFVGSYDKEIYSFQKINKADIQNMDKSKNIIIENGDIFAENELLGFKITKINVVKQMMKSKSSFIDFSDKNDEYLPIYSQTI